MAGGIAAALLTLLAAAQPQGGTERWWDDLERLDPRDPMAYFELGEEVADVADTDTLRALAQRLHALAGVLDPERLGRSACLALADLEAQPSERRRLLAMATLLGEGQVLGPPSPDAGPGPDDQAAVLALLEALSHYRRGQGAKTLSTLKTPGAMELLERSSRFIPGGAERLLEDCKHYRGQLRPGLSDRDRVRMLRMETALLAGSERPWSTALLIDGGDPLVEVDPDAIVDTLGIDASHPYFRGGRWVSGGDRR
ncbi:MAG: hypothetical protein HKO59_01920 [Phycisphaerales bacterium]|nr:hypothetical protein [Phycisphaerales bacterium]